MHKITECKNCKICPYVIITESMEHSYEYYRQNWEDVSCAHPNFKSDKPIESFTEEGEPQIPPYWCPLNSKTTQMTTERKYKAPYEYERYLTKIEPTTQWTNIEVGKIYHLPPVGREKRSDWFILERTDYILRVKDINNLETGTGYVRTIFKSTDECWRLLTPHRMKKILTLEEKLKRDEQNSKYFT